MTALILSAALLLADATTEARKLPEVTQADVDQAIRVQTEKIDACFVALSPDKPKGGVQVRMVVTPSGYVAALELMKNTATPAVGACVLAVLAQCKLPEGPEEFAVEVPIAVGPTLPARKPALSGPKGGK